MSVEFIDTVLHSSELEIELEEITISEKIVIGKREELIQLEKLNFDVFVKS